MAVCVCFGIDLSRANISCLLWASNALHGKSDSEWVDFNGYKCEYHTMPLSCERSRSCLHHTIEEWMRLFSNEFNVNALSICKRRQWMLASHTRRIHSQNNRCWFYQMNYTEFLFSDGSRLFLFSHFSCSFLEVKMRGTGSDGIWKAQLFSLHIFGRLLKWNFDECNAFQYVHGVYIIYSHGENHK